jgi:hypothetical protein
MELLLLTTFPIEDQNLILENCKELYHIYTFFIVKYINRNYPKVNITLKSIPNFKVGYEKTYEKFFLDNTYDHIIVIDNRGIKRRHFIFFSKLKEKVKGIITTISDNMNVKGNEDVLFFCIPHTRKRTERSRYIGWACDKELLTPKQDSNTIQILIDHIYYGKETSGIYNMDLTITISEQIWRQVKELNIGKKIIVKRFCNGGVETLTEENYNKVNKYQQNNGLSYQEVIDLYNTTDIFFVTHPESMGLVVLECAMAGALIVSPEGYIKNELLHSLYHVSLPFCYNKVNINLKEIINRIDHKKSRKMSEIFNWSNAVDKIMDTFINIKNYYKNYPNGETYIFTRNK